MLGIEDYGSGSDSDHEPQPAPKPKRAPKKIAIELPALPTADDDDAPPAKKQRRTAPAGSSALLSLLPAPKQSTAPTPAPAPERVLGAGTGPGLVFRAPSTSLLPPSVAKRKHSPPPADFFSIPTSSTPSAPPTTPPPVLPTASSAPQVPASSAPQAPASSAPQVPDFTPPEPRPDDPYPGYYRLPSGTWAAHDPAYYASFYTKWKKEYDAHVRALEKGADADAAGAQEVDMAAEMDKARREIKEREERKAVTTAKGEPEKPRMNVQGAKLGATARSRHQLTTLLSEAYLNREALEERIAQGRRNRKEAGNKYGF
ncbi:hypothetical protein BV22DRAFT_707114 [Leucogyrophana mollusca]|uniref:Uncharacterized protein n=1 Tax=Leucogyrophana mollusca TaxID=85980 RepID=A0ACB8B7F2_9AGAM|nr:hypothetical protein BV22DRAFT_707114 [Leucogyrophana mollusca]